MPPTKPSTSITYPLSPFEEQLLEHPCLQQLYRFCTEVSGSSKNWFPKLWLPEDAPLKRILAKKDPSWAVDWMPANFPEFLSNFVSGILISSMHIMQRVINSQRQYVGKSPLSLWFLISNEQARPMYVTLVAQHIEASWSASRQKTARNVYYQQQQSWTTYCLRELCTL
jgi:hypothetical protein